MFFAIVLAIAAVLVVMVPILSNRSIPIDPPDETVGSQYRMRPGAKGSMALVPKYDPFNTAIVIGSAAAAFLLSSIVLIKTWDEAKAHTFGHLEKKR